jgi:CBS domain-containing protein
VLTEDEELFDALTELGQGELHRGIVIENSHLIGLLSITDIGGLLAERPRKAAGRAA